MRRLFEAWYLLEEIRYVQLNGFFIYVFLMRIWLIKSNTVVNVYLEKLHFNKFHHTEISYNYLWGKTVLKRITSFFSEIRKIPNAISMIFKIVLILFLRELQKQALEVLFFNLVPEQF